MRVSALQVITWIVAMSGAARAVFGVGICGTGPIITHSIPVRARGGGAFDACARPHCAAPLRRTPLPHSPPFPPSAQPYYAGTIGGGGNSVATNRWPGALGGYTKVVQVRTRGRGGGASRL